jgi:hypothetical protein
MSAGPLALRDIASALRDGPDQSFVAEQRDRAAGSGPADLPFVHQLFLAGQHLTRQHLAALDPVAEPCGYLTVGRLFGARISGRHRNKVELPGTCLTIRA